MTSTVVAEALEAPEAVSTPIPTLDDLQQLVAHLGVPANRILMRPMPGEATEADAVKLMDGEPKRLCELVDGVLVEKAMGYRESALALVIAGMLREWNRTRKLGMFLGEAALTRLWPGRLRAPDVAFVRWERFPGGKPPEVAVSPAIPNLVVEVLSDSNTEKEMKQKRTEYFRSGVDEAWVLDPKKKAMAIYTPAAPHTPQRSVASEDVLESPILPEFSVRLADVFAEIEPGG